MKKNKTWADFLLRAGLSSQDFKALTPKDQELLRAMFASGKKIVIVRAPAHVRDLRMD